MPPGVGACSDVVVRALRHAGTDLQHEIQRDHRRRKYPHIARPDPSIDHRRVRNIRTWLERHALRIDPGAGPEGFRAGDIVIWLMPTGRDHTGVVSDRKGRSGWPAVVHNLGQVAEEDVLRAWKLVGHYRTAEKKAAASPGLR